MAGEQGLEVAGEEGHEEVRAVGLWGMRPLPQLRTCLLAALWPKCDAAVRTSLATLSVAEELSIRTSCSSIDLIDAEQCSTTNSPVSGEAMSHDVCATQSNSLDGRSQTPLRRL
eukprot:6098989-Pleurochrysis_carterae.AAC.1